LRRWNKLVVCKRHVGHIFQVGRGVAHDEYIEFSIEGNSILYQGEESEISAGKIRVEFIKSYRDNTKINGIVIIKGDPTTFFPPLTSDHLLRAL
jgi:hypothetical protein